MSVINFKGLKEHLGHKIVCISYGKGEDIRNVAIECEDCWEVLMSFDKPKRKKKNG